MVYLTSNRSCALRLLLARDARYYQCSLNVISRPNGRIVRTVDI